MKKKLNNRKPFASLEALEKRDLLAADAGFVVIGGELYFEVSGTGRDDAIELVTENDGDVFYQHTIKGRLIQSGDVEADDISLAELIENADFAGFRVKASGGDDVVDLSSLTNYRGFVLAGAGDDTVDGGAKSDVLEGGAGDDVISGGEGNDTIKGNAGDDTLSGDEGNDTIQGGADDDTITGDAGDDTLSGGNGNDGVSGGTGDDVLGGGDGNDLLAGDKGVDELSGGDGDDTLVIDTKDQDISGGDDVDSLFVDKAADTTVGIDYKNRDVEFVNVAKSRTYNLANLSTQGADDRNTDDVINSKNYAGPGYQNNNASGVEVRTGGGDDDVEGSSKPDKILVGDGDDHVSGNGGADIMQGGEGTDTLDYRRSPAAVNVDFDNPLSPFYANYKGYGTGGDAQGDRFNDLKTSMDRSTTTCWKVTTQPT